VQAHSVGQGCTTYSCGAAFDKNVCSHAHNLKYKVNGVHAFIFVYCIRILCRMVANRHVEAEQQQFKDYNTWDSLAAVIHEIKP